MFNVWNPKGRKKFTMIVCIILVLAMVLTTALAALS